MITLKNMQKKVLIFLFCMIISMALVASQGYRLEISTIPEDKIFEPASTIQLKVALYDSNNNLIDDNVSVILEDIRGTKIKETQITSNNFERIELTKEAVSGEGKITARYKDSEATESFFIKEEQLAKFELDGEKLIVTNIGNSIYTKKIYITIGETTGAKTLNLKIGDSVNYRLIAPKGVYNIKVTDGETTLTKSEVQLTGTGNVIGAVDESASQESAITGGISPDEKNDEALLSYIKNSKFVYAFILVIFGAMILLAIERQYRRKARS